MKFFLVTFLLLLEVTLYAQKSISPLNSTITYRQHKGFMVMLNWYFLEPPPMLITKHFKKVQSEGDFVHFRGKYGGFNQVDVSVCHNKITEIYARSEAILGGIDPLLKLWLNKKIYKKIIAKQDTAIESSFLLSHPESNSGCPSLVAIAKDYGSPKKSRRI